MQRSPSGLLTHVTLVVAGPGLDPSKVSRNTGISPHRSFREGERYIGRNREGGDVIRTYPVGNWSVDSTRLIPSGRRPEEHVHAVIDLVYPAYQAFANIAREGPTPQFWVTHARSPGELGYTISASDLKMLADLCVDLSLVCYIVPDPDEAQPESPAAS